MWGSKNSLRRIASLATVDLPFPFPFSSQSPSLSGRRSTANGAAASTHPDRSPHDSLDAHGQQPSPMQSHRVQRMPRDVSSLRSQNGLEMCGRWDLPHYALSFPACGADACGLARNIGPECERVCNEAASSQDHRGVHHPILSATVRPSFQVELSGYYTRYGDPPSRLLTPVLGRKPRYAPPRAQALRDPRPARGRDQKQGARCDWVRTHDCPAACRSHDPGSCS